MSDAAALLNNVLRWAEIVIALGNAAFLVFAWFARHTLVSRDDHVELSKRVDRLEERGAHSPGWGALNGIKEQIAEMEGDLKSIVTTQTNLNASLARVEARVERIETHLLQGN